MVTTHLSDGAIDSDMDEGGGGGRRRGESKVRDHQGRGLHGGLGWVVITHSLSVRQTDRQKMIVARDSGRVFKDVLSSSEVDMGSAMYIYCLYIISTYGRSYLWA